MENYQIRPMVDQILPLEDASSTIRHMDKVEQFGNIGFVNESRVFKIEKELKSSLKI